MTSTNDIRRSFLEFFEKEGHSRVPSAPLVPHNDPTLMFVNAGMVPFKNVFTGLETRDYQRATSSQKCVRAGGKHNDLDNVGYTPRHHTFFEMLGNFSFGDYFKDRAIELAWQLLTKEWGLNPDRLTATVYHNDDQAFDLWRKITGLPEERIIRIATADNFWSMGDTGPCGPCSEIFYDHGDHIAGGPPGSSQEDGDRFVEIWNLVFMQYDQQGGDRIELPRPSIDTGMGLERVAAIMQGSHDNYDIDLFKALIAESAELTNTATDGDTAASHRVIADHLRSASFLIADGVLPANEGRGYVLRRIMRRAMRHAHILGAKDPLMHRLVPELVAEMGGAFPELVRAQSLVEETLNHEEIRFRRTLDNGLKLLDEAVAGMGEGETLAGETAFKLYDTYGFPYDLTEDALRSRGLGIDRTGFETAMAEQRAAARAAWKGSGEAASETVWFDLAEEHGSTEFIGYSTDEVDGQIVAIIKDGTLVKTANAGEKVIFLANQTPFYAESGGQAGDTGTVTDDRNLSAAVTDTSKPLGRLHAHHVTIKTGVLSVGQVVTLSINAERRAKLRANHSATHLMHAALRKRLGDHITQKGSLVAEDKLRFDFSHPSALDPSEIAELEADVNAQIRGNAAVTTRLMTPDEAVEAGALALFGEKYGDEVRVLSMGRNGPSNYSVELCGGTHVTALGDIGLFVVISEGAVASGVRRIEALTGEAARLWYHDHEAKLLLAANALKATPNEVFDRVMTLINERKRLEKELSEAQKTIAIGGSGPTDLEPETVAGIKFLGKIAENLDPKSLRGFIDETKVGLGSGIVAIIAVNDGRASVAVGMTDDLTTDHDSVALVRIAVDVLGGKGGGGRNDMAQGGGPEGDKANEALAAIRETLEAGSA